MILDSVRIASQHGSVSDVLQISDSSLSVQFFQSGTFAEALRDELRGELETTIENSTSKLVDERLSTSRDVMFDPDSPEYLIEKVIADRIRPGVNSDGGDVELVELTAEGVAVIRMKGACNGCPSSDATLKNAIEKTLLHFCGDHVKSVQQEEPIANVQLGSIGQLASNLDLPSVISHEHNGMTLENPLSSVTFPVVSLFARKVDKKMLDKVRFASHVHIPQGAKTSIDVWVKCVDCGTKKRLEDVNQLITDAQQKDPSVQSVGVVICPACAVIVTEKPEVE